ncbi:type IX secretion/gliding motility protein PorT/SprT [Aquirufa sp. 5-AUSEE-100C1]
MDSDDRWNLFHLPRPKSKINVRIFKKIGTLCLILFAFKSWGQHTKYTRIFHEYYDEKPVHFGFLFGFASTNYSIQAQQALLGTADSVRSPRNFGFQIGGLVNYAFDKHWEIKSGINIALYEREIQFRSEPNEPLWRESTWLEIPVLLKLRSVRRNNHRLYVIGGAKLGIEANVKKKSTALSANTADLSLEYGFGLEQYFQFFKFTPEIRFSHGLLNLYVPPSVAGAYSKLNGIRTHTVTLLINFE